MLVFIFAARGTADLKEKEQKAQNVKVLAQLVHIKVEQMLWAVSLMCNSFTFYVVVQRFDTVGWAAGRASRL